MKSLGAAVTAGGEGVKSLVATVVKPKQPSPEFVEAVKEAHDALWRKGIRPMTPQAVWEYMATKARMEGTFTQLMAWEDDPDKPVKSYAGLIERLIRESKIDGLEIHDRRGVPEIEEEIPF